MSATNTPLTPSRIHPQVHLPALTLTSTQHTHAACAVLCCASFRVILGESTPLPVMLSLVPIMFGVGLASAGELSFNWTGFISAMLSNLTFGFRAVWGKR